MVYTSGATMGSKHRSGGTHRKMDSTASKFGNLDMTLSEARVVDQRCIDQREEGWVECAAAFFVVHVCEVWSP